jgi:hypothetical protein
VRLFISFFPTATNENLDKLTESLMTLIALPVPVSTIATELIDKISKAKQFPGAGFLVLFRHFIE